MRELFNIQINKSFKNNKKIQITYEELAKDPIKETNKIQEFLEIKPIKLSTRLKKQNKIPLSKSIKNYWELKEKFKNRRWEEYFEE